MARKVLPFLVLAAIAVSCATQRRINSLRAESISAVLALPEESESPEPEWEEALRDTFKVRDAEGKEILIMKAVRDENGDMVASDEIDAAYVSTRFRNIAERNGKVDIRFDIVVPEKMQDSKWQLRFRPEMEYLGEMVPLDPVIITGKEYRKAQLRGYQQYEKFLSSIITDTTTFIRQHALETFIRRNLPQIYAFRNDTSKVSDEEFASVYGVTQQEAVRHYTDKLALIRNNRRIKSKDKMFNRYVKVPIMTEGLRLDTVLTDIDGNFVHSYVQTIMSRPGLKSVSIGLEGQVYEEDRMIYEIPRGDGLQFYISSVSSFVDDRTRYLTTIIQRQVSANSVCMIDFPQGSSKVDTSLGDNAVEIERIMQNLAEIGKNEVFELDSVVVTASSSPEGGWEFNRKLSEERSRSVAGYFRGLTNTRFSSENIPENWDMLDRLVANDDGLTEADKLEYKEIRLVEEPDRREMVLSGTSFYKHLKDDLYPKVRTVRFEFMMHRKDMVQDTLVTSEIDTTYMKGIQAVKDRDYKLAIEYLGPYKDFNAAVAYCALDYNASAMDILEKLEPDAKVLYMKALVHSRQGNLQEAVQSYLDACSLDPSMRFRGNLDPEISELKKQYSLEEN